MRGHAPVHASGAYNAGAAPLSRPPPLAASLARICTREENERSRRTQQDGSFNRATCALSFLRPDTQDRPHGATAGKRRFVLMASSCLLTVLHSLICLSRSSALGREQGPSGWALTSLHSEIRAAGRRRGGERGEGDSGVQLSVSVPGHRHTLGPEPFLAPGRTGRHARLRLLATDVRAPYARASVPRPDDARARAKERRSDTDRHR